MELHQLTIHEAAEVLREGRVTSEELLDALRRRIEAVEPKIHSYVTVLQKEDSADAAGSATGNSLLTGIPLAVKDNIVTRGIRTTCSSKILENFIPPYDAGVVTRLKKEGAVLLGKTNLDEFAMGSSTETSAVGTTRNPWNPDCIPGGSSGGSAAAVAADACIAALGSDTGGSIRQPAAHCGVVGLKPTYGRVSRFGLVAFASSLDQIGPLTKDVEDSALLLQAIAGHDPKDSTSADHPVPDYSEALTGELSGKTIGVPKEYFVEGMQPEVEEAVRRALALLEKEGAKIVEVSLPHTEYAVATYYILATAEASSNLARYDGVKYGYRAEGAEELIEMYRKTRSEGFGPEVKRRIMLGTYALSSGYYDAYYRKARQVRTLIRRDFDHVFEKVDVLVTPTAPTTAFKIGEKVGDPLQMYLSDILTIAVNLAGIPAISIPCGFDNSGLPVGLQVLGKHFDEASILNVAYAYEQRTDWHKKRPVL
ncbi:MAG: Asp-tRNA(Asn)/Glu-tRNA(Gln) amidotransferase subunit GatA [Deltaproteobacteria bacterium]|nr:Asp-tRNA(Asn)/Glu-tRNA(Gln) amidotransferase subunit GatA [Deltaproteobacteria bacterium]